MPSYNRTTLVGNITKDLNLRHTPNGNAVLDFSLAVNERYKQDNTYKEKVHFIDITAWDRLAENIAKYLGKGSPILIEGRLSQDRWEKDGIKNSKLKVIAERMQMLGNNPNMKKEEKQLNTNPF